MGIAMKHALPAVVLWLAASGTVVAADNSLAGQIQGGHRDAALKMIAAGADVNAAQGDGTTPLHLIRAVRPDVLVKGADYRKDEVVGAEFVEAYGGRVHLATLHQGFSTTTLLAQLRAA